MKLLPWIIIFVLLATVHGRTAHTEQGESVWKHDPKLIARTAYQAGINDALAYDDIGLRRLTLDDVEELL